jgi:HD-like signal output (HDOD) protein
VAARGRAAEERWPVETITALAAGRTAQEAAAAGKVPERTLRRWREDPAFRSAIRAHRAEAIEAARAELVAAAGIAVRALVDVAKDGPPPARVSAARAILDLAGTLEPVRPQEIDWMAQPAQPEYTRWRWY